MKKLALLFLGLFALCSLCACGGDVRGVRIEKTESALFSEEDISAAIRVVVREFDRSWSGCSLRSIGYAGDEMTRTQMEYYLDERGLYDADEMIVLLSSFDVDASGGDGSMNPNSRYEGYAWLLVRSKGGPWRHVDHGYG